MNNKKKLPRNIARIKNGKYILQRYVNGKNHYFGIFNTLQEVIDYKEYCIRNNWSLDCKLSKKRKIRELPMYIYKIPGGYFIKRRVNGKDIIFGSYNTLDEAKNGLKRITTNGWDINKKELRRPKKDGLPKYITKVGDKYLLQKQFKDYKKNKPFRIYYDDLETAIFEKELWIRADWSVERFIELDETYGTILPNSTG